MLASLPPVVTDSFCCPCPGCRVIPWPEGFLNVNMVSKKAESSQRAKNCKQICCNMSKLGLMLSTLKSTSKPQPIQPRSRPHIQSCDILTNCLDKEMYRNHPYIVWHIFQCGILLKSARPSDWNQSLIFQLWFQIVDSWIIKWTDQVLSLYATWWACVCVIYKVHMFATGENIVSLFCVTLQWHCLHI